MPHQLFQRCVSSETFDVPFHSALKTRFKLVWSAKMAFKQIFSSATFHSDAAELLHQGSIYWGGGGGGASPSKKKFKISNTDLI